MTQSSQPQGTIWQGLRDPRSDCGKAGAVTMPRSSWQHTAERHICRSVEPWDEVFPAEIVTALQRFGRNQETLSCEQWEIASNLLGEQVRQSLDRPLVILYLQRQFYQDEPYAERWLLLLPCGGLMAIRSVQHGGSVLTCFFMEQSGRGHQLDNRWKYALFFLRNKYSEQDPKTGRRHPPHPAYAVPIPRRLADEDRAEICFVTEHEWHLPGPARLETNMLRPWPTHEKDTTRSGAGRG